PEAAQLLMTPELRPENELLDFCKETRLTRVMLREAHVRSLAMEAAAQQQAIKIGRMKVATEMAECGIEISADEFPRIGNAISTWSPQQRLSVTGPDVARDVAVAWFLSDREYYFEAV